MTTQTPNPSWPGWETVGLIGRGSFGAVYEIQRDVLGETEKAALKVVSIPQHDNDIAELYSEGYTDESITSTFREHLKSIVGEYSLMRKMNGSANIVNCDDVRYIQHDDGIGWDVYIKMELLTPLTKALPNSFSEEVAISIARDLCAALILCKKHGILHRDIKPQNIFVSPNGDYKLGDFGIAKMVEKTTNGTKIGTYKYMAPEVYNNQPYGATADIYSLGMVLYWLLNQRRLPFLPLPPQPLKAGADEDARRRRLSGEPLPPPVNGSDALKAIALKACAYQSKYRYQTPEEMLDALNDLRFSRRAVSASAMPKEANTPASPETPVAPNNSTADTDNHSSSAPEPQQIPAAQSHLMPLHHALPESVPEKTIIALAKDLCAALSQNRDSDTVRQDIEPRNIFLSPEGRYQLGSAASTVKIGNSVIRTGSKFFMAPEVCQHRSCDITAEIYSLGMVLYWLLNQRRMPFQPLPPQSLTAGIENTTLQLRVSGKPLPPPAHGSNALKAIVLKACVFMPQYRYQSLSEMLDALNALENAANEASHKQALTPLANALPAIIPEQAVISLARDICAALAENQSSGTLRQDIEPKNIYLTPNGEYRLESSDKVLRKSTGVVRMGSCSFVAPEVYHNRPFGISAETYSLGLVMYWLLNERRLPFLPLPPQSVSPAMEEFALQRRVSGKPLPPPVHGSDALKAIVLKACVFMPQYRYQSHTELLKALNRLDTPIPRSPENADVPEDPTVGIWTSAAIKNDSNASSAVPVAAPNSPETATKEAQQ